MTETSTRTAQATDTRRPVTVAALIRRINRKLAREGDTALRVNRARHYDSDRGQYYEHDWRTNFIVGAHIDPEEYGREMGVLKGYERVVYE
jgi:hypothetical protein